MLPVLLKKKNPALILKSNLISLKKKRLAFMSKDNPNSIFVFKANNLHNNLV